MAELQRRAKEIPNLISPHLGDDVRTDLSVAVNTQGTPGPNQIVALPIGGRVKIDPWSDKLVMLNSQAHQHIRAFGYHAVRDHAVRALPYAHRQRERRAVDGTGARHRCRPSGGAAKLIADFGRSPCTSRNASF